MIRVGNVIDELRNMPDQSVHCVTTSPPYWGLRAYQTVPQIWGGKNRCRHEFELESVNGQQTHTTWAQATNGRGEVQGTCSEYRGAETVAFQTGFCRKCSAWLGELGSEPTIALYVSHLVDVFAEVWRVLRDDGCLWLNLGDSYCAAKSGSIGTSTLDGSRNSQDEYRKAQSRRGKRSKNLAGAESDGPNRRRNRASSRRHKEFTGGVHHLAAPGLKPKDMCGIPWRVAFALQDAGWYLRAELPWVKRTSLPESVEDRPNKALEYVFLLTKQPRYFYDWQAVRRSGSPKTQSVNVTPIKGTGIESTGEKVNAWMAKNGGRYNADSRNFRNSDLWFDSIRAPHGLCGVGDELVGLDVLTEPVAAAHFATFPSRLIEPLIKCGSSEKGCCPTCGAPWIRVLYRAPNPSKCANSGHDMSGGAAKTSNPQTSAGLYRNGTSCGVSAETIGWQASCACPAHEPIPCAILDPFLGSGTTAIVAEALGRDWIGIELNGAYAEIARKRIARGYSTEAVASPAAGQGVLFP